MSYLVHMQNKATGVTYVYESTSSWNAKKKQPRNKRRCIGKLDPETEALVPSKRLKAEEIAVRDLAVTATVLNIGASLLRNPILESTDLANVLRKSLKSHLLKSSS